MPQVREVSFGEVARPLEGVASGQRREQAADQPLPMPSQFFARRGEGREPADAEIVIPAPPAAFRVGDEANLLGFVAGLVARARALAETAQALEEAIQEAADFDITADVGETEEVIARLQQFVEEFGKRLYPGPQDALPLAESLHQIAVYIGGFQTVARDAETVRREIERAQAEVKRRKAAHEATERAEAQRIRALLDKHAPA